jgi:hypothetical protein
MKVKNNIIEDLINRLTYFYILLTKKEINITSANNDICPLWVSGMFRSGTTITTQILEKIGMDLGPTNHLLKAKGQRAKLNPNGFYENYLFMDWSLMVFNKLDSWGDNPPAIDSLKLFNNDSIKYKEFVYNSVVNIHDDRISNRNKASVLSKYFSGNFPQYLNDNFNGKIAIKNPHFSVLYTALDEIFPKGKYLIVFRNPTDAIRSAKQVTPNANYNLYVKYYSDIINHPNSLLFNYDELINDPEKSIISLSKTLNLNDNINEAIQLISVSKKLKSDNDIVPQEVNELYLRLKEKAINK